MHMMFRILHTQMHYLIEECIPVLSKDMHMAGDRATRVHTIHPQLLEILSTAAGNSHPVISLGSTARALPSACATLQMVAKLCQPPLAHLAQKSIHFNTAKDLHVEP